jgi:hypothetical protein
MTTVYEFVAPALPPPRCTMTWPSASSRPITWRTVGSLMFALRAIVAADGQHPVPSSRGHPSARRAAPAARCLKSASWPRPSS